MDKAKIIKKLISVLKLRDNPGTLGEKQAAERAIETICQDYNLKVDGKKIYDLDSKKSQNIEPPKPKPIRLGKDPNCSHYVVYNGVKYYGGVPDYIYKSHQQKTREKEKQRYEKQQFQKAYRELFKKGYYGY